MPRLPRKNKIVQHIADRDKVRYVVIGVRLSYEEDDWVTQQAMKLGMTRPDVCREALQKYMRSVTRNEQAAEVAAVTSDQSRAKEAINAGTSDRDRVGTGS